MAVNWKEKKAYLGITERGMKTRAKEHWWWTFTSFAQRTEKYSFIELATAEDNTVRAQL